MSRFITYTMLFGAMFLGFAQTAFSQTDYAELYCEKGKSAYAEGKLKDAQDFFSLALTYDAMHERSLFNRGQVYLHLNPPKRHKALEDFNTVLQLNPQDERALRVRGNLHFELGNFEAAIQDYDRILAMNPNDEEVLSNRGLAQAELGNANASSSDYESALQHNAQNPMVWTDKGQAAYQVKDFEDALISYREAILREPNNAVLHYYLAEALMGLEQYAEARLHLMSVVESQQDARVYANIAACYLHEGNGAQAQIWAEKSKAADMQEAEAHHVLGMVAYSNAKYGQAERHFEDCIAWDASHAKAQQNLAKTLYQLRKFEEAEQAIERSIALDALDNEAFYMRALIYLTQGKRIEACADYHKALSMGYEPQHNDFEFCLDGGR